MLSPHWQLTLGSLLVAFDLSADTIKHGNNMTWQSTTPIVSVIVNTLQNDENVRSRMRALMDTKFGENILAWRDWLHRSHKSETGTEFLIRTTLTPWKLWAELRNIWSADNCFLMLIDNVGYWEWNKFAILLLRLKDDSPNACCKLLFVGFTTLSTFGWTFYACCTSNGMSSGNF